MSGNKTKLQFDAIGTARKTKDGKSLIVTMFNGDKYYISTPKSQKQLDYYKANTKEYYDTLVVQAIKRPE